MRLNPVGAVALALAAAAPLVTPLAASASPAALQPRQADARDPRDPRAQREAPELICRSVETADTGETPLVCMTAADWRRAEQ